MEQSEFHLRNFELSIDTFRNHRKRYKRHRADIRKMNNRFLRVSKCSKCETLSTYTQVDKNTYKCNSCQHHFSKAKMYYKILRYSCEDTFDLNSKLSCFHTDQDGTCIACDCSIDKNGNFVLSEQLQKLQNGYMLIVDMSVYNLQLERARLYGGSFVDNKEFIRQL